MNTVVIREGKALIHIPDPSHAIQGNRFEPAWLPVFYNPLMVFNRDLSILVLDTYTRLYAPHKPIKAIDALSGTGVRAVRLALEFDDIEYIHANDIDPLAVKLIEFNSMLNNVGEKVKVHRMDANRLLNTIRTEHHEPILYVDIDPFGSPAPFAREALYTTGHHGLAAFTATDLGVLEGSKPRPARRKYWVEIRKTPESKEVGLRVLLGFLARTAASLDKSIRPLLSYYADHYYRVYLLLERGSKKADAMLESMIGYATYCKELKRTFLEQVSCPSGEKGTVIGPLWKGPLSDPEFVNRVGGGLSRFGYLETFDRIIKLVDMLVAEAHVCTNCLHYRIDYVASAVSTSMPPRERLIEDLISLGYRASRTHFSPLGIRTNAPYSIVSYLIRKYSR